MDHQKKILILGASLDQIKLIKTAKDQGYYVIDCDFTTNNPGLSLVDKHYQVDYLDKEKVLKIALDEGVIGIISNSEQAMPTVAYVSERLSLPGNTSTSIQQLADKLKFRDLQKKLGEFCPKYQEIKNYNDLINCLSSFSFPIVIKPNKCSATRGVVKIDHADEVNLLRLFENSKSFSWNGKVSIEEYVDMPSLTTYEGDIFVVGNDIIWDGMFYTQRSTFAPMIPMTYSGPLNSNDSNIDRIKNTLKKLFNGAGIHHGEYNVELYITKEGKVFVIEINTRQGGRNLPEFIQQYSGVDFTKLLITTCMNDFSFYNELKNLKRTTHYITHHLVFPHKNGKFADIVIHPEISRFIIKKEIDCKPGDYIQEAQNGTGLIGFLDFEFPDQETRNRYAFNLENFVKIKYQH